jgi:glycosyltransferase involved in cell wall biosynthesis
MNGALVSIIINNYNYGRFLAAAIDSALQQTYSAIEVIVVDDGSTDESREVIESYGSLVRPVMKENGGQASAFNLGFAKSKGEVVCFLDSDDLFLSDKVARIVESYDQCPDGWCFHCLQFVDAEVQLIAGSPKIIYETGFHDFRAEFLAGRPRFWPPATSGLTFSRQLLEKLLPMPEEIRITSDNYLKASSLALSPGFYIAECLGYQRVHGANAYTLNYDQLLRANVQLSIAKNLRTRFPELMKAGNRMFASALAAKWRAGGGFDELSGELSRYLVGLRARDKAEILLRGLYRAIYPHPLVKA